MSQSDQQSLAEPFSSEPRRPNDSAEITIHYVRFAPWSSKVEMALRHMGLPGEQVQLSDVDLMGWFDRRYSPIGHRWDSGPPRMIPFLEDHAQDTALSDSTPILHYLERRFPDAPRLFPDRPDEVDAFCIHIDGGLAQSARRLFLTKLAMDRPDLLGWGWGGSHHPRLMHGWRALRHRAIFGASLVHRFALARNVEQGLYRRVRDELDEAAQSLGTNEWLFDRFGAADMTLAASVATLRWVPWLVDDPKYARLFEHTRRVYARLDMPEAGPSLVQGILSFEYRPAGALERILGPVLRVARALYRAFTPQPQAAIESIEYGSVFDAGRDERVARNDQRPLWGANAPSRLGMLWDFLFVLHRQRTWLDGGDSRR